MAKSQATPAAAKTAVANVTNSDLAFAQPAVPDYIKKGEARGSEEVKQSDMVLPRLEIVQSTSPIKEADPDVREGNLFNTVTQEVYGDLVYFVPIYFRVEYLVWKDQDKGGGFFGSYPTMEQGDERKRREVDENGEDADDIEVIDTPVHYGLLVTPPSAENPKGTFEQIVISMARSKSKISRKWNAMIQIAGGDRFSRVYKISTFTDENKQGKKFKNYVVQPAGFPTEEMYRQAEKMYTAFRAGEIKGADHESAARTAGSGEGTSEAATGDRGGI